MPKLKKEIPTSFGLTSPQPKKVKCECGKSLLVKFVISQQDWSKKNN